MSDKLAHIKDLSRMWFDCLIGDWLAERRLRARLGGGMRQSGGGDAEMKVGGTTQQHDVPPQDEGSSGIILAIQAQNGFSYRIEVIEGRSVKIFSYPEIRFEEKPKIPPDYFTAHHIGLN